MNRDDIKSTIGKLVPDEGMEHRLSEKVLQKTYGKFIFKPVAAVAVSLVIALCLGITVYNLMVKRPYTSPYVVDSTEGIYIPKIELPEDMNFASIDMIGLIVYQDRIYYQSGTNINAENAEKLLGEKLGTTTMNISELSKEDDYEVELASSIGEGQEVYSVTGYDKSFRIMTYNKIDGTAYAQLYECLDEITVKTGADVFNKFKIENNIKAAKYESFDSWNYGSQEYKELKNIEVLNKFADGLKNTIPYTRESLSYLFNDNEDENQKSIKVIYIVLNDGSEVRLMLYKDGYIHYNVFPCLNIYFKMENGAFTKLWNELK